jgi:hypothetical protein
MLLINRFAVVSTGWKTMSSAIPAHPVAVRSVFPARSNSMYLHPRPWLCWIPSCTPSPTSWCQQRLAQPSLRLRTVMASFCILYGGEMKTRRRREGTAAQGKRDIGRERMELEISAQQKPTRKKSSGKRARCPVVGHPRQEPTTRFLGTV